MLNQTSRGARTIPSAAKRTMSQNDTKNKQNHTRMKVLTDVSHVIFLGLEFFNGVEITGREGGIILPDSLQ